MKTGTQLFSNNNIPSNLPAEIKKVRIDGYTQKPSFFVVIPSLNRECWTWESNMVLWGEYKEFTDREKEIIQAANERAAQIRLYHSGQPLTFNLDKDNPLNKFPELS